MDTNASVSEFRLSSRLIGLTGGIGCGKSTVVGFFNDAGWRTIESDAVVRDLLSANTEVQAQLRGRWGEAVFTGSGVDRRAVAARVFEQESELRWLEDLLHPLVREHWQASIEEAPDADWLVEIPLLFEKRLETLFDLTVCVASPPDVVERRMVARGYTGAEVAQRRERQMPLEEKVERADYLISNAGSLEFLKRQTTRLIEQITTL
ncbi:dephospho-CoA kinase [Coraliomargarita sp. SDUM461004]|uniref:Dephospho-CoA kinase n=1 Tax=Thalassobacterium sedimentorum TaxID=3041258 RepID=A0ABU1ALA2_9BACT|nr:dephospho-CoA kinase [Coraliomargarita sp. SDUM461004]MDQ8194973.1 dephospho-CoA kinase [Coraliomargarita sp. SDUM461004]